MHRVVEGNYLGRARRTLKDGELRIVGIARDGKVRDVGQLAGSIAVLCCLCCSWTTRQ
jgi:hypothetical protein